MSKVKTDSTAKELQQEIDKWFPKVKKEFQKIKSSEDKSFLKNIEAYIKDTQYFLDKEDLIRAFEAVIWAWAWLEIGKRKKIIQ
ncbi:DUF357 domain-containing protein [Candidatus Woesearchaeota archaeon]|nr:DUF357 domain-containing protein [Candidatus Woesearchaeota archaeon]